MKECRIARKWSRDDVNIDVMRDGVGSGWVVTASVGIAVLIAGCGPPETDSTSTAPTLSTTTLTDTSTTLAESETTLPETTTTTSAASVDSNVPPSMSREEIPWPEVGDGWYVALYDSSQVDPDGGGEIVEGPVVLFLVDSDGNRYEVSSWPAGDGPWWLTDAVGTTALVEGSGATLDDFEWQVVDLMTGAATPVHTVSFPESAYSFGPSVALTRPSGANIVVYRSDGTDEWLERRSVDGTVLDVVYQQPYVDGVESLRWMYGYDGTSLLVTHHGGIVEVSNTGEVLGENWVPPDHRCEPVRWWDADTFLAVCYGQGPGSAPIDTDGNPHTYYGRLWLLETDGSAGTAMTEYPTEPPIVVDFGYHDAWPAGSETLIQWSGDCGSSQVATLQPDGTGVFIEIDVPESIVADGVGMVDVMDDEVTVYGWEGCGGWVGALFVTDLEGEHLRDLVPIVGDSLGVIGARGLATVYP